MILFNNQKSIDLQNSSQFPISKYKKACVTFQFFLRPAVFKYHPSTDEILI